MADRDIHCHTCHIYVGTIRDAKLMVGVAFVCPSCREVYLYEPSVDRKESSGASGSAAGSDSNLAYLMDMLGMGGRKR